MEVKSFLRHICLSNSGEKKGFGHVILETKRRVEHIATQTQMIRRFAQEDKSTEHVEHVLSSHPLVSQRIRSRPINNPLSRRASVSGLIRNVA